MIFLACSIKDDYSWQFRMQQLNLIHLKITSFKIRNMPFIKIDLEKRDKSEKCALVWVFWILNTFYVIVLNTKASYAIFISFTWRDRQYNKRKFKMFPNVPSIPVMESVVIHYHVISFAWSRYLDFFDTVQFYHIKMHTLADIFLRNKLLLVYRH